VLLQQGLRIRAFMRVVTYDCPRDTSDVGCSEWTSLGTSQETFGRPQALVSWTAV